MTNGEKIQQMFPRKCPHIGFNENFGRIWLMQDGEDFANFTLKWWNAEYKEPNIRNCFGCKYSKDNHNSGTEECHLCMWENQYTPTTKNNLGVDCISRKAAEDITWHDPSYTDPLNILTEVRDKIRELPSVTPQPRWIPVSERLPEKYTYTLWCASSGYVRSDYFNGEFWEDAKKYCYEVIAWMPLPKAYSEVEE